MLVELFSLQIMYLGLSKQGKATPTEKKSTEFLEVQWAIDKYSLFILKHLRSLRGRHQHNHNQNIKIHKVKVNIVLEITFHTRFQAVIFDIHNEVFVSYLSAHCNAD